MRLAAELSAAGDEVLFLAPDGLAALLGGAPVRHGRIDRVLERLGEAVLDVLMNERWDSLVLVDLAAVYKASTPTDWIRRCWDGLGCRWRRSTPGAWRRAAWPGDYGPETYTIDTDRLRVMGVGQPMVPVPIARPDGTPGAYDALPALRPPSPAERQA